MGHYHFIHHQFQMGITKMMLKLAFQNLPSQSSTGMSHIGQAFGTSMTLLFTKNKILVTLISLHYPKSYLGDSANSVLSGLTLTSENYKEATLLV